MSMGIDIQERIADVCGHLNVLHGQLVELMAEVLHTEGWRGAGFRSPEHWLTIQAGIDRGYARRIVDVARRREELPTTISSLEAGETTLDQAAVVAKYVPAHNDKEVAGFAQNATVTQLRSTLRRYPFDHAPDDTAESDQTTSAENPESAPGDSINGDTDTAEPGSGHELGDQRRCSWFYDDDGVFHLTLQADADDGALIDTALTAARARLFNSGQTSITNVDVFMEMANQSLEAVDAAGPLDRLRVHVHLDTEGTFIHQGPKLPPSLIERILCNGTLRPIWETEGHSVNVGRDQRVVPERTRKVIEHRDQSCRFPGCTRKRHLEVHHVIHWLHDGDTDTWNLVAMCGGHHRAHHRGEFELAGNADIPDHLDDRDGLRFTRPDGSQIRGFLRPNPPNGPPPAPIGNFRHPTGERFDPTLVSWRNRDGSYDYRPVA